MSKDFFDTCAQLTETTLENAKKVGAAQLKLGEKLLDEQVELAGALFGVARASAEKSAEAKDLQALAANGAEAVQESGQLLWKSCQTCAEYVSEAGRFFNQLFEAGLKTANTNMAGAKAKARKSA